MQNVTGNYANHTEQNALVQALLVLVHSSCLY